MIEKIKRINNPLTIIAVFAALAEINATIAIGLIDKTLHHIFIWFVIGFPSILVILFFVTLNFNTKVMYSPSDYNDDKSFMDSLFGNYYGNKKDLKEDFDPIKLSNELENKLINKLEDKLDLILKESKSPSVKKELETIKSEIKNITDQSINEVKNLYSINTDLKEILLSFYQLPAFFVLIYVIVKSEAKSINKLKPGGLKIYIPGSWEDGGLPILFDKKLLIGTPDKFEINPLHKDDIIKWVNRNQFKIKLLSNAFRKADNSDTEDRDIEERIRSITNSLKF